MRALYNRVRAKDPMWKLAGFIVDEPSADILAIRYALKSSSLKSVYVVGSTGVLIRALFISYFCFYKGFFFFWFFFPRQGWGQWVVELLLVDSNLALLQMEYLHVNGKLMDETTRSV